ncbi:hypothetical protein [Rhodococcus rhodochrous]|uniref:Uncharacterized protein n=1 Tax=Rhodococcus rhodochrous TaxID=1829 RepID=A0AAW4XIJ8_RHORH|nr:hypothetical protein [Rhodococcus rhodochrous]MCD2113000.1 hypothetical protein [Rhodococcus rhodochrous]
MDEFGSAMRVRLVEDVLEMASDGRQRDLEFIGDGPETITSEDTNCDVRFGPGQSVELP